jgi:hypothetical protein
MPLYVGEYIANTMHLSITEHGAFFRLLLHQWQHHGELPSSDRDNAIICGMSPAEWAEIKPTIMDLFTVRSWWGETVAEAAVGVGRPLSPTRPSLPPSLKEAVRQRDGNRCQYCGASDGPMEIDHRLPWSRGGKHELENLALACLPCNRDKRAMTVEEWRG